MPPTPFLLRRLRARVRPTPVATVTAPEACACCRLSRDEHGVQLMHRFVPPGQPVATW